VATGTGQLIRSVLLFQETKTFYKHVFT